MKINDQTKHQRIVFAHFDEAELYDLLAKKVAAESGLAIDPKNTEVNVFISTKERGGLSGREHYAEVKLTADLAPGNT